MKSTILCCLLLPCLFQGKLTISKLIDRAEKNTAAGAKEAAAAELLTAIALAQRLESKRVRKEILKRAEKALKKADRDHASTLRTKRSAAKRLVSLARKYEKKGWLITARDLAFQAEALSKGTGGKLLASLPARKAREAMRANQATEGSTSHPEGRPWRATEEELRSDELKPEEESSILFHEVAIEDWSMTCRLNPNRKGGSVGILFGHRSTTHYSRLRLVAKGKNLELHLETIRGKAIHRIYAVRFKVADSELGAGIPLIANFDGRTLQFRVGELQSRRIALPLGDSIGRVGLWAQNRGKEPFQAIFGRFRVFGR